MLRLNVLRRRELGDKRNVAVNKNASKPPEAPCQIKTGKQNMIFRALNGI